MAVVAPSMECVQQASLTLRRRSRRKCGLAWPMPWRRWWFCKTCQFKVSPPQRYLWLRSLIRIGFFCNFFILSFPSWSRECSALCGKRLDCSSKHQRRLWSTEKCGVRWDTCDLYPYGLWNSLGTSGNERNSVTVTALVEVAMLEMMTLQMLRR